MTLKEAAIDCELNKAHNMMNTEYRCFKFEEHAMFDKQPGPAFKDDEYDDARIDSGIYSPNSYTKKIKVLEIKAVKILTPDNIYPPKYSESETYWYYPSSGIVYDYINKDPIGKIGMDENNLPNKLDKDTYIIKYLTNISKRKPLF